MTRLSSLIHTHSHTVNLNIAAAGVLLAANSFVRHDAVAHLAHKNSHRINDKSSPSDTNCIDAYHSILFFSCQGLPGSDRSTPTEEGEGRNLPDETEGDRATMETDSTPDDHKVKENGNRRNYNRLPTGVFNAAFGHGHEDEGEDAQQQRAEADKDGRLAAVAAAEDSMTHLFVRTSLCDEWSRIDHGSSKRLVLLFRFM